MEKVDSSSFLGWKFEIVQQRTIVSHICFPICGGLMSVSRFFFNKEFLRKKVINKHNSGFKCSRKHRKGTIPHTEKASSCAPLLFRCFSPHRAPTPPTIKKKKNQFHSQSRPRFLEPDAAPASLGFGYRISKWSTTYESITGFRFV